MDRREFVAAGAGLIVAAGADIAVGSETLYTYQVFIPVKSDLRKSLGNIQAKDIVDALDVALEAYPNEENFMVKGVGDCPHKHLSVEFQRSAAKSDRRVFNAIMKDLMNRQPGELPV